MAFPPAPTWVPTLRLQLDDASFQRIVAVAGSTPPNAPTQGAFGNGFPCLSSPISLIPGPAPLNQYTPGSPYVLWQYEGDFYQACKNFQIDLRPGALYLGIVLQPTPLVYVQIVESGIVYLALPDLSYGTVSALAAACNALVL